MTKNTHIGLAELIDRIKQELMTKQEENALFFVEDVTLEINFVVSGDLNSGFNFGVVTLGSDVSEQRVQKIMVKLTPIFSKEDLKKQLSDDEAKKISQSSSESLFKGGRQVK